MAEVPMHTWDSESHTGTFDLEGPGWGGRGSHGGAHATRGLGESEGVTSALFSPWFFREDRSAPGLTLVTVTVPADAGFLSSVSLGSSGLFSVLLILLASSPLIFPVQSSQLGYQSL